jgi:phosphoribosyl-AMP cyclohydrolase
MKFPLITDVKPNFTKGGGLVAAIAQDAETREVLMLAWMNQEAWKRTLETGEVHYYSRSRKSLWHKGGTSGHVQKLKAIRMDCDSDALVLLVEQIGGAACHEGFRSCFSRELTDEGIAICCPKVFDPKEIYI